MSKQVLLAGAEQPPVVRGAMPLDMAMLQSARAAGMVSRGEYLPAAAAVAASRAEELTLTYVLNVPRLQLREVMIRAIMGTEVDGQGQMIQARQPIRTKWQLRSLLKRCKKCASGKCEFAGKCHPIAYKTAPASGTGSELATNRIRGKSGDVLVFCQVDPETGLFREQLSTVEAIKCLRQHGFGVRKHRMSAEDDPKKRRDMWIVDEPQHMRVYGPNAAYGTEPTDQGNDEIEVFEPA